MEGVGQVGNRAESAEQNGGGELEQRMWNGAENAEQSGMEDVDVWVVLTTDHSGQWQPATR